MKAPYTSDREIWEPKHYLLHQKIELPNQTPTKKLISVVPKIARATLYQLSISSFLLPHSLHGSVQPTTSISWPMIAATTATMQCLYQALLKQHFLHETRHAWVMEIGANRHPYALLVNHASLWCNWRIHEHHLQQNNMEFQHAFEIYFWCATAIRQTILCSLSLQKKGDIKYISKKIRVSW